MKVAFQFGDAKKKTLIEPSPELIDILWGNYLATGAYRPIGKIVRLLPLANDRDSVDNLTTGSAAKFTLASNAVRDQDCSRCSRGGPRPARAAAKPERRDGDRRESTPCTCARSLAAIESSSRRPQLQARTQRLGQIGQGALSMGCIVAAVTGQIELGIPCVVGGAAYSAGMQYMAR